MDPCRGTKTSPTGQPSCRLRARTYRLAVTSAPCSDADGSASQCDAACAAPRDRQSTTGRSPPGPHPLRRGRPPASASVAAPPTPRRTARRCAPWRSAKRTDRQPFPVAITPDLLRTAPPWNPPPPCPRSALATSAKRQATVRRRWGQFKPSRRAVQTSFSHHGGLAVPTAKRGARNCVDKLLPCQTGDVQPGDDGRRCGVGDRLGHESVTASGEVASAAAQRFLAVLPSAIFFCR
jgi:hypothetical protein